jgi:hypothetical protein
MLYTVNLHRPFTVRQSYGRMTGRAAATGLPRRHQHLRLLRLLPVTTGTKTSRSSRCATRSQYCNANSATPGRDSARLTGRCLPRSCFDCPPDLAQAPSAGAPGHDPALAPRHAPPKPRRDVSPETPRPTTHHPVHPTAGSAPGQRKPELGATAGSTENSLSWACRLPSRPCGRSSLTSASTPHPIRRLPNSGTSDLANTVRRVDPGAGLGLLKSR